MIEREISKRIINRLFNGKAIILTGARQVGKTTLVKDFAAKNGMEYIYLNCDEPDVRELLNMPSSTQLRQLAGNKKIVIIDEAQRIPEIGITAKLFVDNIPEAQLVMTGSSSFDMNNSLNEPLTGRKFIFNLFPFSFSELSSHTSILEEKRQIENRLIYGCYPDIVNNPSDEKERLIEVVSSYLFKDILAFGQIRKPDMLDRLLQALALQLGSEVSLNELASSLGIDKNTISKYIDMLEKSYVIFSLYSFSRNLRNELKKSRKIYFWDNGVRNAVIKNFNPPEIRADKGHLWENYIIAERMKYLNNIGSFANSYFWRNVQNKEIDYIEEYNGEINAYEIKWNPKAAPAVPMVFSKAYPGSSFKVISTNNHAEFISGL